MRPTDVVKGLSKYEYDRKVETDDRVEVRVRFAAYRTNVEELKVRVCRELRDAHHPLQWAAIERAMNIEVTAGYVPWMASDVEVRVRVERDATE